MNIIFGDARHVVIDHIGQIGDVKASCSHIRCHEDADLTVFELSESTCSERLTLVAMQRNRIDSLCSKFLRELVCPVFCAGKNQHSGPTIPGDQVDKKSSFIRSIHQVNLLNDRFCSCGLGRHLDKLRIMQHFSGKIPDLLGVGGGKQHGLPFGWNEIENFGNLFTEPQIQHPVRLIENKEFYPGKIQMPLAGKIQQTAGCGHNDIDATPQPIDLRIDANPAVNHGASHGNPPCIGLDALPHLKCQFPGGGQDQCAGVSPFTSFQAQNLNQRECKCVCFSCSGLSAGKNVPSLQNNGNGLDLNGGGGRVALCFNGFKQFDTKTQLIK